MTAGLAAIFAAAPAAARTLEDELGYLLDTHPQLRRAARTIEAADAGIAEVFSRFLPQVQINADLGYGIVNSPARRETVQKNPLSGVNERAQFNITQNLYDGLSKESDKAVAERTKRAAQFDLSITEQNLLFQGASAYINLIRQIRLLELARKNEDTIQEQLALEDERVRRGSGLAVDVLLAKTRLQTSKERRVGFEGELQNAITRYIQTFDRAPELAKLEAPGGNADLEPDSVETAIQIARVENPSLLRSNEEVEIASERRRGARSGYFPKLDLIGNGLVEDDKGGTAGIRKEVFVGAQATWDLFSGFATASLVERVSKEYGAAIENHLSILRDVIQDVRLSWESLQTTREQADLLENAVVIAGEVFEARTRLRTAGKETAINVLDAENELDDARIRHTSAFYDAKLAAYRLLLAVGRLSPKMLALR